MKTRSKPAGAFARVESVVAEHGPILAGLPGVVEVWAGFKFRKGRLTDKPAVIVSVLTKEPASKLSKAQLLPKTLAGVPVDVVPASAAQLVRFALVHGGALTEKSAPNLAGLVSPTPAVSAALAAVAAGVPRVPYVPSKPPLAAVNEKMKMVCHASPDAGFRLLSQFFGQTEKTMTATMYEFTAKHILKKLIVSLASSRKLRFIMDGGNAENETARAALKQSLKTRMDFMWAAVADTPQVIKAFFPTAYHIKVAVRDGKVFWLSSGNWKDSNQPLIDPITNPFPTQAKKDAFHRKQNRDWHVVVENAALASQFERFILHDIKQAKPFQKPTGPAVGIVALLQEFAVVVSLADAGGVEFFPEQVFEKKLNVTPLLTPDNYMENVLPLIKGAKSKLYFQNQSLSAAIAQSPRYAEMVMALREKSKDSNIDVRIIIRGDFDPFKILSDLAKFGFKMARVKLQKGNHNKGILIDDKITVVGSHNWTGQGTTENRDASLIIRDAGVTEYYTKLFLHDWTHRSTAEAPAGPAIAAVAGARIPPGAVRFTAREVAAGGNV
ncbi:MAG TPA: phospholipase D-like domain-containing protein [Chthoniobacterales bacterium]|nr:phospholipase D-like domain-containing protein [Chthoniobacterales bacterium]